METAKTFDELMQDKNFISKLNQAKTPEEAQKMCAEQGFDLNSELADLPEGELSAGDLDTVAGGGGILAAVWGAYKGGMQVGVVIRNLWDRKHGRPLSYPNWKFEW